MGRRLLWGGIAALALAWLVPAGFVLLYEPAMPAAAGPLEGELGIDGANAFLASGYVHEGGWTTWVEGPGGAGGESRLAYRAVRGALDAGGGTFPLEVAVRTNEAGEARAVRLDVTEAGDGASAAAERWQAVAEAPHPTAGSAESTFALRANVPAGATAYRVVELHATDAGEALLFSRSIPTAPTWLGRAYDQVAWRLPWRWLPAQR